VVEAEVTLEYYGPTQPRFMPSPARKSTKTTTSATGTFTFRIDETGYYGIKCAKPGYHAAAGLDHPANVNFSLAGKAASRDVKLFLSRPATVTGTIVDAETGNPITGLKVGGGPILYLAGRRIFMVSPAITDSEGRFRISGAPGDYAVQINPQPLNKERVLREFSAADFEQVDQDYDHTFWPGGQGEDSAMPVPIGSGGLVDLGRIRVKRVPYYRVRLHIPKDNCQPDDRLTLFQTTRGSRFDTRTLDLASDLPCGADVLIRGFEPGAYRLSLATRSQPRSMAAIPVTIAGRNVDVVASLSRGVSVDGKFILADGASKVDFTSLHVWLDPVWSPRMGINQVQAADQGEFRLEALAPDEHRATVRGVPPTHYVKEMRFNGALLFGNLVPLDAAGMARSLTIVLDDKPAALSGVVRDGDSPVVNASVVVAAWPWPPNQVFFPTLRSRTDEQGRFQIGGLAPGEYRAVALRSQAEEDGRLPDTLERAFAAADRLNLGPRESRSLTLRPVSLR
jgi:hypothetical protein